MHCIKSQRQVWTWCSCYLSRRFTQSKLDSCFFLCATLGRLGFWQLFGPHWHERLESLSRWKPGWPSWHFTKQIRQEVLTIRNDIADPSCICLRQTTSLRQKDDFEALLKRNFKRKIINAKIGKICWQITIAALMQPFQYDLQSSAAKDNSITHAAAAPSNLDAATPMRSAETELQNTIELRAMASEIAAPKPDGSRRQSEKKTILMHFLQGILKGKLLAPKLGKSADKWLSQPGCSHSNTIYNLQLQKTIVLRMQPLHQATLTQPLQCDLQRLSCKTQ